MKKIITLCIVLILFLGLVAGVNAWVDPAGIASTDSFNRRLTEIFDSGLNAVNIDNYNGRAFMRYYISSLTESYDTVVLGSSHGIQFSAEMFDSDSFFNSCVTGAEIEDVVSIYQMYHEKGIAPKNVVLCVDSWFLDANKQDGRWKLEYPDYYENFCRENGINCGSLKSLSAYRRENAVTLLTPSYFQESINDLGERFANPLKKIETVSGDNSPLGIVRCDGSYRYPESYTSPNYDEYMYRVSIEGTTIIEELQSFTGVDTYKASLLTSLLDMITDDGGNIVVFLAPFNNLVYERINDSENCGGIFEIEEYIRSLCESKGIEVVGSYDPVACGFEYQSFIDGLHLNMYAVAWEASEILPKLK